MGVKLSMTWCPELGIFRCRNEANGKERTATSEEVNASAVMKEIGDAAKRRPNVPLVFDATIGG